MYINIVYIVYIAYIYIAYTRIYELSFLETFTSIQNEEEM